MNYDKARARETWAAIVNEVDGRNGVNDCFEDMTEYSEARIEAALAAARQEAFEECAKIAERYLHTDETIPAGSIYWLGTTDAANGVAAAIRAASIQEPTDAE